jgi:putative RecB family exonuclease
MKCERLSASRAGVYENCPLRYYARYHLKKRSAPTSQIDTGLFVHEALELYYDPEKDLSEDEAFREAKSKNNCRDFDEYEEAKRIFKTTVAKTPKSELSVVGTEVEFDHIFESGLRIMGYVDRLDVYDDNTLRITDFKTGFFVPTFEELEKAHQTNMYPLWIYSDPDFDWVDNIIFTYHYVREGVIKSIHVSKEKALRYKEYAEFLMEQILRNEDPQPTLNPFCWNCEHRADCSVYQTLMKAVMTKEQFITLDDEEEVSIELVAEASKNMGMAQSSLKKEKSVLDSWLLEIMNSRNKKKITAGDNVITVQSRKRVSYDPEVVRQLATSKAKFKKVFSVKPRAVKDVFADDMDALDLIERTSVSEQGSPFISIRKESK